MWLRVFFLTTITVSAMLVLAACSDDDDPVDSGVGGGGGSGQPPVISRVVWTHEAGCTQGVSSPVTIQVEATDPDTGLSNLSFSGSVTNCGSITSATTVISCPQLAAYAGSVTVTDPQGNSDTETFSFGPCEDGQAP